MVYLSAIILNDMWSKRKKIKLEANKTQFKQQTQLRIIRFSFIIMYYISVFFFFSFIAVISLKTKIKNWNFDAAIYLFIYRTTTINEKKMTTFPTGEIIFFLFLWKKRNCFFFVDQKISSLFIRFAFLIFHLFALLLIISFSSRKKFVCFLIFFS